MNLMCLQRDCAIIAITKRIDFVCNCGLCHFVCDVIGCKLVLLTIYVQDSRIFIIPHNIVQSTIAIRDLDLMKAIRCFLSCTLCRCECLPSAMYRCCSLHSSVCTWEYLASRVEQTYTNTKYLQIMEQQSLNKTKENL